MLSRLLRPKRKSQRNLSRYNLFVVKDVDFLKYQNVTVNHKTVLFDKCPDIPFSYPGNDNPPTFPEAETVFVIDCDKNFVYYYINKSELPKMRTLYLASHPCEYPVLNGHQNINTKIFLSKQFRTYFRRWGMSGEGKPKIELVEHGEIVNMTNSYHKVFFEDYMKNRKEKTSKVNFDNCAQCMFCYDIITSIPVHDFKYCSCKLTFIDGGSDYRRAGGVYVALKYIENEEELLEARKNKKRLFSMLELKEMKNLVSDIEEEHFIDYYKDQFDIIFLKEFYDQIKTDPLNL